MAFFLCLHIQRVHALSVVPKDVVLVIYYNLCLIYSLQLLETKYPKSTFTHSVQNNSVG